MTWQDSTRKMCKNAAFTATKLAIAAFIVPYVFALNQEMLLVWDLLS